ncbi:hypothetical protein FB451DRAFT_1416507 [Mycena latifolia]|nr:hypothetical protein FB451DRAFT_1416507 [Mycena latifolia]
MTLFALFVSLRTLRELITRVAARMSTLHALVHAHSTSASASSSFSSSQQAEQAQAEVAALVAYIDDALGPLEKGVKRVERRVDKLRAMQGVPPGENGENGKGSRTNTNTVFVPAPPKPPELLAG